MPGHNISKRALENMRSFTSQVVEESMSLAAEVVRTRDTAVLSNIPGHTSAMLASTLLGIVEATTQIRVLELQLMPSAIKYLITLYINGYAGNARSGLLKDRLQSPKIILHLSWNIKPSCPVNFCGTSQAMEGSAAVVIWKRSEDRNQLVYST